MSKTKKELACEQCELPTTCCFDLNHTHIVCEGHPTSESIEGVTENTSDGYHTFKELYEHRIVLWIKLCDRLAGQKYIWASVKHSDGTTFGDWFVLGMNDEKGKQITYHLPARYWNEVCEFANILEKAPDFDGHTSADVLKRIPNI